MRAGDVSPAVSAQPGWGSRSGTAKRKRSPELPGQLRGREEALGWDSEYL